LFPAVDLIHSPCRLLDEGILAETHCEIACRARACLKDFYGHNLGAVFTDGAIRESLLGHASPKDREATEQLLLRACRLDRFLTQPYHGTELWIGEPGETVAIEDALEGTRQILDGLHDALPENAFGNAGTIEQVVEKAGRM
jgi:F-type H+-transporting ATPase subunit beta